MGGYYVVVKIPCPKEQQLEVWWRIARFGYNFTYEEGEVVLFGRHKNKDDLAELYSLLEKYYPDHKAEVDHDN